MELRAVYDELGTILSMVSSLRMTVGPALREAEGGSEPIYGEGQAAVEEQKADPRYGSPDCGCNYCRATFHGEEPPDEQRTVLQRELEKLSRELLEADSERDRLRKCFIKDLAEVRSQQAELAQENVRLAAVVHEQGVDLARLRQKLQAARSALADAP